MANEHSTGSRMDRRRFIKTAGAFGISATVGGIVLSGCGGGNGGGEGGGPQTVELTVSHHPTLLYSVPWLAAIEQGLFEDEDINVKGFVGSEGGGTTVRNVVTGGLPLGAVATPASINAYDAGSPLQIIAGAIQTTADINFVTLPGSGIKKVEDLGGKRIGFTNPGSVTHALATLGVQAGGFDPADDVELQAMGGLSEALTGLKEGVIDLAPHIVPTILTQPEEDWQIVFWTDEIVPSFMQLDLIAGSQPLEEQPELIEAVLRVYERGIEFTIDDPAGAAKAWAKNSDVPEDAALESIKRVDPSQYYGTQLSADGLNTAVEAMKAVELLDEEAAVDWEGLINQTLLSEDKKADLNELK